MTDWRRTASQPVQEDIDGLLAFALDHAVALIKREDRLVPFAVALPAGGPIEPVAVDDDTLSARARLDRLYAAAREQVTRVRAIAFTADITLEGGRAIRIEAEHRDGVALALRVPYRRTFLGGVKLATMRADPGPSRLWP